jgi:VanZ family protein
MCNRNGRLWVYGIFLATGSALLFLGGPDYYSSRSYQHFWDTGHILYFALLASLLSRWGLVYRRTLAQQWTIILATTLLAGASIEVMQYATTRTPDMGDVLRDLTGSLLILAFGPLGSKLRSASRRLFLQFSVLLLLLTQLWPATKSLVDESIARHQFPLLSGLETPFEIDRWSGSAGLSVEPIESVSESNFLKLSLTTDQYSGAALNYFDGDWTSARSLRISLYNPDASPLQITCRIHDRLHSDGNEEYEDRFNRSFLLAQGWNHLEIDLNDVKESPAGRSMDMSKIRGLGIFVMNLPASRTLYIDEVRLSY